MRCSCSLITRTYTHSCPAVLAAEDVLTACSVWIMNESHQPTHLLLSSLLGTYIIKFLCWDRNNRKRRSELDSAALLPPDLTAGNICSCFRKDGDGVITVSTEAAELWGCCSLVRRFAGNHRGRCYRGLVWKWQQIDGHWWVCPDHQT